LEIGLRIKAFADVAGKQAEDIMSNQLPQDISELEIEIKYSSISGQQSSKKCFLANRQIHRFPE
jgi:hypothetical protein